MQWPMSSNICLVVISHLNLRLYKNIFMDDKLRENSIYFGHLAILQIMHRWLFRTAKELVQTLPIPNLILPYNKKV